MEKYGKLFRFGIFSSAEAIKNVGIEFLVRLGVYTVWIGVESKIETYEKNRGIDLRKMIGDLRNHGVSVLASGVLFIRIRLCSNGHPPDRPARETHCLKWLRTKVPIRLTSRATPWSNAGPTSHSSTRSFTRRTSQ